VKRLPYFPEDARRELAKFSHVIVLGCRVPVAMFGYADNISQLVDYVEQTVVEVRLTPSQQHSETMIRATQ
jgi:hypothetical protein